ncbi:low specificity L-threonine aldolase [Carbonactinospora thermoautotrophica]|uniref:threonine aldolase family protein n=2 Tax=Carbonactinospora thermoautotrophica TaxID=1469144 RepID=UPI00226E10FB|nr:GntG family PLP-dependent aldolase [Carbonactinospora thermoautotrophica]MCX9190815.1 low specificity L-threonine aldolase [Carbonactinospora thermoautotrophica]
MIDLRSDTVTRPTPGMRRAMAEAEVGDDVYGEDPTVRRLEERVAELFGKEAALYVPSGTMGNQIALRLLCPSGEEVLADADAHIVTYEGGGIAQQGGIQTRTLVSERGLLDPDAVAAQLRAGDWHTVGTRAVAVEHTHNRGGGSVYPLERLRRLRELTRAAGVALHCDGARIWNAHVATGVPLAEYGALFDTLSVCLSKGLGAPVGSVVLCSAEQRPLAWRLRHRLGGNMRQAGIIAAGGLYAVEHHVERLAEDHANARLLADLLDLPAPETNIVLIPVPEALPADEVARRCREQGVLVSAFGPRTVRLVTHLDVDRAACEQAAKVVAAALAG